ncbi:hypothetical protein [Mucilaginibacter celer]|uniref:Uncharacterized protein n=1 Tax=Mucilaginibacter celer TaxID=2305508 RepID=A0A494VJM0_9SPHI|nr:hypothetical protein [Mucilaginibacter celer]AYL95247.1 hypothetical protein HYN43_008050 [Mucilaginibacter celer]
MKEINLKSDKYACTYNVGAGHPKSTRIGITAAVLMLFTLITASGCRKLQTVQKDSESNYGYGKLTVQCESKCHISFGTADRMNVYDVDANTGVYYIRYQTKYQLDISITPTDVDQNIIMNVYSREEKQIFHNAAKRKLNDVWESKILIP